jgi:hypothetical protein
LLFPEDRCERLVDDASIVRLRLKETRLCGPRMRLIRGFLPMAIRQKKSQADAASAASPPKPSPLADFALARPRN